MMISIALAILLATVMGKLNSKDLPSGKFLDDLIVLAILERKFLLSLRIIKFSQGHFLTRV